MTDTATRTDLQRLAVLISSAQETCGVEAFARLVAEHAGPRAVAIPLGARGVFGEALVINVPVVAWKKRLLAPITAALAARRQHRPVILVLHEWGDLDWKRRVVLTPLVLLATGLAFSAPEIRDQFEASPLSRHATNNRAIVPVPANLSHPETRAMTETAHRLDEERARGRLIIGHFGSIYPKKQSTIVLEVAAELLRRGHDPFVAYLGSFVKGEAALQATFNARIATLGLADRVLISGYIPGAPELFALFDRTDVFVYAFPEGLTARRGSVLAAASSGKPVVVNASSRSDGFDHHPTFRALFAAGRVTCVPHDATPSVLADAVLAAQSQSSAAVDMSADRAWSDVLGVIDGLVAASR